MSQHKPHRPHVCNPAQEKAEDLRHTLISSIVQKLQRMDLEELREVYTHAAKVMDKKKTG